jgi:hypothetical protein
VQEGVSLPATLIYKHKQRERQFIHPASQDGKGQTTLSSMEAIHRCGKREVVMIWLRNSDNSMLLVINLNCSALFNFFHLTPNVQGIMARRLSQVLI